MKKAILIVLALALLAGLALGAYYRLKMGETAIEQILPEGCVFYINFCGIEKQMDEFKKTRLWANLQAIDLERILQESGLDQEGMEKFNAAKAEILNFVSNLSLNKFFGKELALAFYPVRIDSFNNQAVLDEAKNLILVTRVEPESEFIELLNKLFSRLNREIKQSKYQTGEINLIELGKDISLGYTRIEDLLVIGLGHEGPQACLDVVNKERIPLCRDRDYAKTMARLPGSWQTCAYANLELFSSRLKEFINVLPESEQFSAKERERILQSFKIGKGLKTLGLAADSGKMSRHKIIALFNKDQIEPSLSEAYLCRPQKNNSLRFIPINALYYQWNGCFLPQPGWEDFKQELFRGSEELPQGGPRPEELLKNIEEKLGLSIEYDIIPALGDESGGFLSEFNLAGPFPIPQLLIFVKIDSKQTIKKAIDNLARENDIVIRAEEYQGQTIESISLPFSRMLKPAFCFLEEYFLVSVNPQLIKDCIDSLSDPGLCLLAHPDFQELDRGLSGENNSIVFMKLELMLNQIQELCQWAVSWVEFMQAKMEAYKQRAREQLETLNSSIAAKEEELNLLKTSAEMLKSEIASLQSRGLNVSSKQDSLAELNEKIAQKQEQIKPAREDLAAKEKQLEKMIEQMPSERFDLSLVRFYYEQLIFPIFQGLAENKAMASRSIIAEDIIMNESFIKTER